LFLFNLNNKLHAQTDDFCGTQDTVSYLYKTPSATGYYGFRKASVDTLRMLMVFVRPKNDSKNLMDWPAGQDPTNYHNFLSFNPDSIDVSDPNNFSSYFKVNSNSKFIVYGDVMSIELSDEINAYGTSWGTQYKNSILEVTDSIFYRYGLSISNYDNWTYSASSNNHLKLNDNSIDFVLFVYKDLYGSPAGFVDPYGIYAFTNTSNGFTINYLSSAYVRVYKDFPLAFSVINLGVHELGHYLLSGQHSYNEGGKSYNYHSIYSGAGLHTQTNAFEKNHLGWIDVPTIESNQEVTLSDFTTTGDAVRIFTGLSGTDSTFTFLEYHKMNSVFDRHSLNTNDQGLIIYNGRNELKNNINNFRLEPASGRWNWYNHGFITQHNDARKTQPILEKTTEDPASGRSVRDFHIINGSNYDLLYIAGMQELPIFNTYQGIPYAYDPDIFWGKMSNSAFNLNGNGYYSSITNPSPIDFSGNPNPISVRLIEETSSTLKFEVEFNPNPYSITKNTTFGGEVFLEQNLIIESGATVTFNKGTTVYLGENVQIIAKPGSKINVNGIVDEVVTFKRLDPTKQWKGIWLQGNNNTIYNAVFDGGKHQLMVQSSGNYIGGCLFKNGWRGIDSYANQSTPGYKSYAYVSNCRFENFSSAAIVTYNTEIELNFITATQSNNGVYGYYGDIYAINQSIIESNSYGINLYYGSSMNFDYSVLNIIRNNSIGIQTNGSVFAYISGYDAMWSNSIYNNSTKNARAYSSSTIKAEHTWWNSLNPVTTVSGNVDFTPFLSSQPVYSNSGSSLELNRGAKPEVLVSNQIKLDNHKKKILQKDNQSLYSVQEIMRLARVSRKDDAAVTTEATQFLNWLSTQSKLSYGAEITELASLLHTQLLLDIEATEEHLSLVSQLKQSVTLPTFKKEADLLEMNLLVRLNKEEDALALISQQLQEKKITEEEKVHFQELKEVLQTQLELNTIKSGKVENQPSEEVFLGNSDKSEDVIVSAYPNPFNPTTTISLKIAEKSNVSLQIYTSLGQLVKNVHSGALPSGLHSFVIQSSNWSSGVYFYRVSTSTRVVTGKILLIK